MNLFGMHIFSQVPFLDTHLPGTHFTDPGRDVRLSQSAGSCARSCQLSHQSRVRGGAPTLWGEGAPTTDVGAFRQKDMQKRKNWFPLGRGRGCRASLPGSATA